MNLVEPIDVPKPSRGDAWVNRVYFVLLPIILGIVLIVLFVTLQTNNQNKDLNQQNLRCSRIVAEAIAKYTDDHQPIKLDPKTCKITTHNTPGNTDVTTPAQSNEPVETPPKTTSTSPSVQPETPNTKQNNDNTNTEQNPKPDQGDTPPKLLDCKVDLLGAHLGCP